MKTRFITLSLFCLLAVSALTSCGKNNGGQSLGGLSSNTGPCGSGYLMSPQYGCLPQSYCQQGYALYNNQCVYAGSGTNVSGYPNGNCTGGNGYYPGSNSGCPYPNGYYPYGPYGYPGGGYPGSVCNSPYTQYGQYCLYWYGQYQYNYYQLGLPPQP